MKKSGNLFNDSRIYGGVIDWKNQTKCEKTNQ